jgi:hypothetical protein
MPVAAVPGSEEFEVTIDPAGLSIFVVLETARLYAQ